MSLSLWYNFKKQIDMLHDLITEETEVFYTNDEQLSYEFYSSDYDYVELYIDDFYIGVCEVWLDAEMDYRQYIILNYTIVYLDTIKLKC
jgi:hypothetical protein